MGFVTFDCGCKFEIPGDSDVRVRSHNDIPVGIDLDIYNVPLDCPKTWALFAEGRTKGVFQLEAQLGRSWSKKLKPDNMEELAALVAILRPGSLKAFSGDPPKSMTQRYVDRKHKREDVAYLHPSLKEVLDATYGVLCYQEEGMQLAVKLAGFTLEQADVLRKAIGKKKADIMAKVREEFIAGCQKQDIVNEEQANEIFDWIQESQKYQFNKSHAVSYAKGAYWTAYLKAHFPLQFYCSFLYGARWKPDPLEEVYEIVNDAKLTGIRILPPDLRDQRSIPYIKNGAVYFGLGDVKQIGDAALTKLSGVIKHSDVQLESLSWLDYLVYISPNVSSSVTEALIMSGSLDYMKRSRNEMAYEVELFSKLTKKEVEWVQNALKERNYSGLVDALRDCGRVKKEGGGCHNAKRVSVLHDIISLLTDPPHKLYDTADFIAWSEEKFLGVSLTCSTVDGCEQAAEANATCLEVARGRSGYTVLAVEIKRVKEVKTKKGKNPGSRMAFLGVSDNSCAIDDVVAFPDTWRELNGVLYEGNTVLLQGERNKESFVVRAAWQI